MAKTLVAALALAALPAALAFRDTSPFFLFSTEHLNLQTEHTTIGSSAGVTADVLAALKGCPTRSYILIEQQGVSSADFLDGRNAPQLSAYMSGKHAKVKTTYAMPEVAGQVDSAAILAQLHAECAPKDLQNNQIWFHRHVSEAHAASVKGSPRRHHLERDDTMLGQFIVGQAKSQDYTVIYITSPQNESQANAQRQQEQYAYEMAASYPDGVQMELKRDLSAHTKRANATEGGLFERYQYFTPGLFMGFAAIIPLFLILLVGIRALTSLEVSYYAFSKEMGPNVQRRQ